MRCLWMLGLLLAVLGASQRAEAWDGAQLWYQPAHAQPPGGGGRIGTGSAGDHGITCAHCHLDSPQDVGVVFSFSPPLTTVGNDTSYQPGQTYDVTVDMTETLGTANCPEAGKNFNGFAATFEKPSGETAGSLLSDDGQSPQNCPSEIAQVPNGSTFMLQNCGVIIGKTGENQVSWSFTWTAPPAGSGEVTMFYGATDGNCDMNSAGDDTIVASLLMFEGSPSASNAQKPGDSAYAMFGLLPFALSMVWVGRRPRRGSSTRLFAAAILLLGVFGCGDNPSGSGSEGSGAGGPGSGGSGASGGTTSSSQGGSAGSGGSGAGGTGSGGSTFTGYTQVDGGGDAQQGSSDVAIAPDGTIYVSWADTSDNVLVARSTDGGMTFGAPVQLDDGSIVPLISMARHPWIAADDSRVAVAFNEGNGTVHLYAASTTGTLTFDDHVIVGSEIVTTFRDFPKPAFLDDGSLVVAYQAYPQSGARIFLARENNGFVSEVASSGAPGVPCECCPLDVVSDADGDLMVAFRNNDGDIREMWLSLAPQGGAFASWVALSNTEGYLPNCPMQGPRLAQIGASNHIAVWSRRGQQSAGSVEIGGSDDGGQSWSGGSAIPGFMGDEPTVAVAASGRIFVTAVTGNSSSSMVYSDNDGATWSAPEALVSPDGDVDVPQAHGGGGLSVLSGVSSGNVWLLRME